MYSVCRRETKKQKQRPGLLLIYKDASPFYAALALNLYQFALTPPHRSFLSLHARHILEDLHPNVRDFFCLLLSLLVLLSSFFTPSRKASVYALFQTFFTQIFDARVFGIRNLEASFIFNDYNEKCRRVCLRLE